MNYKAILAAAFGGFLTAFTQDLAEFNRWQSIDDAIKFNWKVAIFKYVKGAILGAIAGATGAQF